MSRFRHSVIAAALALAAPGLAIAADEPSPPPGTKPVLVCNGKPQEEVDKSKTKGTVIGAVAGGVLGNVVASKGVKTEGAVLGAAVGAVTGRVIAKKKAENDQDCHYEYVPK